MIDVEIAGLADDDVSNLRAWVTAPDMGGTIANNTFTFDVDELPQLACTDDGVYMIRNLPIGYDETVILTALEGVPATLHLDFEGVEDYAVDYDVTLKVSSCL